MRSRRKKRHLARSSVDFTVRSEINVTPLVDVCLVLLIIFMVIMPLLSRGKEIPLPKTQNHSSKADQNQPIIVLDEKGQIYLGKDPIAQLLPVPDMANEWRVDNPGLLAQSITSAWKTMKETAEQTGGDAVGSIISVKAPPTISYGEIYPLVMQIHGMGISSIDLATQELKK